MKIDTIVVGCGLAGLCMAQQLHKNNKSFVVFNDYSQQSSTVAGGMYNPVILKRFTPVWKRDIQLKKALPFYEQLEQQFQIKIHHKQPVKRLFASVEEQNNWFVATDKYNLQAYLSSKIETNTNSAIKAHFGLGEVLSTGRIDTSTLIKAYCEWLKTQGQLFEEKFNYQALSFKNSKVYYNTIEAKHIIFCEGFGLKKNPYFKTLPLNGTKGELLTIYAPQLQLNYILKSSVFLIPLGQDHYIVGATYNWTDKTNTPTQEAKEALLSKLKTFITCPFEVVNHVAGIRPTVIDRKPLVGQHAHYKNMFVLNGLGTRGVMIAPYVAEQLYNFIDQGVPLEDVININRFDS